MSPRRGNSKNLRCAEPGGNNYECREYVTIITLRIHDFKKLRLETTQWIYFMNRIKMSRAVIRELT